MGLSARHSIYHSLSQKNLHQGTHAWIRILKAFASQDLGNHSMSMKPSLFMFYLTYLNWGEVMRNSKKSSVGTTVYATWPKNICTFILQCNTITLTSNNLVRCGDCQGVNLSMSVNNTNVHGLRYLIWLLAFRKQWNSVSMCPIYEFQTNGSEKVDYLTLNKTNQQIPLVDNKPFVWVVISLMNLHLLKNEFADYFFLT